jgi:hypothetical protein
MYYFNHYYLKWLFCAQVIDFEYEVHGDEVLERYCYLTLDQGIVPAGMMQRNEGALLYSQITPLAGLLTHDTIRRTHRTHHRTRTRTRTRTTAHAPPHTHTHPCKLDVAGCHTDGFQGARITPKLRSDRSYVVSNTLPTVFYLQPFAVGHLDPARHNFFLDFDRQVPLPLPSLHPHWDQPALTLQACRVCAVCAVCRVCRATRHAGKGGEHVAAGAV